MSWRTVAFWLLAAASVVYALTAPDATGFPDNKTARLIFLHLPCAFIATGLIVHSAWLGMRFLQTREPGFDAKNAAATELGAVFAFLTMASGIVFSKLQWGAWWQNDPRQTSFLVVLLLCCAGVALRAGIGDEQKAAKASAAYSVATVLPMLFLIFVLPRILESFHPSSTLIQGEIDGRYWIGILLVFVTLVAVARTFYVSRARSHGAVDAGSAMGGEPKRAVPVDRRED